MTMQMCTGHCIVEGLCFGVNLNFSGVRKLYYSGCSNTDWCDRAENCLLTRHMDGNGRSEKDIKGNERRWKELKGNGMKRPENMVVYGCIWLYMGCIWLCMAVYGCIWLYS